MASADGWFYMFDVNTQEGGICKLLTQASIYTSNPSNQLFTNNNLGNNNTLVPNNTVNNPNQNNFNANNNNNMNQNEEQQAQMHEKNQSMES